MRVVLLMLALAIAGLAQAKTYRWVDEDGRVHYGDRIPAKYAQQQAQTLNDRGIVIEQRNAPKSAEQLAAESAERKAAEEAAIKAAEQGRYDDWLMSTYATQDQLIARRDDQMAILDSRIASGEKSVNQNQASLDDLRTRAQGYEDKDKPVPSRITKQISEFDTMVRSSDAALEAMRAEREKVNQEFERELNRWLELKGKQP
ncbi:MAG: DUF4124 domain-containing protein [Oceanococcus sp.]